MTIWIKRLALIMLVICLTLLGAGFYIMHKPNQAVPVLNYHQINDRDENALTVHTNQFDAQMKYLAENGYHTITPKEMLDAWDSGTPLPEKPVIITFDDGYADNYRCAYPILQKYNLRGTIFLVSDFISTYPNYLTWAQVLEMQESGLVNFESHTLSHAQLDTTSPEETWNQLSNSKKALEWYLKKDIDFLAYPCGFYDEELQSKVKEAGYKGAFTVNFGLADKDENRYVMDRVPIFGCTNHTLMRFRLRLQYAPIFAPLARLHQQLLDNNHTFIAKFIPTP
ncbi:MAG: polysaccharide deacetylase family protein [Selenomonas sp.]|nr:polysaccharide deacetylase family protein [Selenomonas sp.]